MGSYQQIGTRGLAYGEGTLAASTVGRMLLAAAFVAAICLITFVIGVASVQYP
jgi:hypothetical protein